MTEKKVVERAKSLFDQDSSAWNEIYSAAKDDMRFLSDDPCAQWDETAYKDRIDSGRPALTIDQLTQYVHQVANDIRMNTPSIHVIPGNDGNDETAQVLMGLIRQIEHKSNADAAYDTASLNAVKSSLGFIRVDHDYSDDNGFNQELQIKRVVNPLTHFIDSTSTEPDGRDAMHGFAIDEIKVRQFKKRWPGKEVVSFDSGDADNTDIKDDDAVKVCEFFEVVEEEEELTEGEISRTVKRRKVMRYMLSGKEVLEETTFPGKYIPIVPVYGEEAWVEGKRNLYSLIRKSKGAQQMFNLWKSLETELLMKQPQAPVMAAEGQIEDYAQDWSDPSKSMALRWKPTVDENGNSLPPPQRLNPPVVPTGVVNASRMTIDDIKATMGLYNASLGDRSNETSGIAIARRKEEGDTATYHFGDNLVRSITHIGRIIVSAIPEIYDSARIIQIIGEEEKPEMVGINGEMTEQQEAIYDLTSGNYDVRVITGASYSTKRQETVAALNQMFASSPELMKIFGDIFFRNSDFAGAQAMASRAEKLLPPELREDGEQQDPEKIQMQQALEQAQAQIAQMQQEAQSKQEELQVKARKDTLDAENNRLKAELEYWKAQSDREKWEAENELKAEELAIKLGELDLKAQESQQRIQLEQSKIQNFQETTVDDIMARLTQPNEIRTSGSPDDEVGEKQTMESY